MNVWYNFMQFKQSQKHKYDKKNIRLKPFS